MPILIKAFYDEKPFDGIIIFLKVLASNRPIFHIQNSYLFTFASFFQKYKFSPPFPPPPLQMPPIHILPVHLGGPLNYVHYLVSIQNFFHRFREILSESRRSGPFWQLFLRKIKKFKFKLFRFHYWSSEIILLNMWFIYNKTLLWLCEESPHICGFMIFGTCARTVHLKFLHIISESYFIPFQLYLASPPPPPPRPSPRTIPSGPGTWRWRPNSDHIPGIYSVTSPR
jgi:hypothetical protein